MIGDLLQGVSTDLVCVIASPDRSAASGSFSMATTLAPGAPIYAYDPYGGLLALLVGARRAWTKLLPQRSRSSQWTVESLSWWSLLPVN